MRTRGFGKTCRLGGKVVPEAVEINPLAACDEPLHVRATEAEMPQQRVLEDFLPRANAGHRRIHEHELRHTVGMPRGKRITDHVADIVRHDIGTRGTQHVHHADDIICLVRLFEPGVGPRGQAHAAQVGHDHRVIAGEIGGERHPHVAGVAIAVQQHDRRSRTTNADMQGGAVGRDVLLAEGCGEMRAALRERGAAREADQGCRGKGEAARGAVRRHRLSPQRGSMRPSKE
ncbi:hypothetical protein D9M73_105860 [compost metagenome]